VHHAWLFTGPDGVGKESAARAFAKSLLCQAPRDGEACGECPSCGKVDRGVHPDLVLVLPEALAVERGILAREELGRTPSRELKIEQVRGLEGALALAPVEGERRVVLLLGADSMNVPAQNAFLKTLEEPPAGTHLVLLAETGDALLATIRSRCVRVPFGPLPLDFVAERVAKERGIAVDEARLLAALAGGSLGRALALTPEALEDRARILSEIESLDARDFRPLLALAERMSAGGRAGAEILLDAVALFYRDVAVVAEGGPEEVVANRDLLPLLRRAAERGCRYAIARFRRAERARLALERHVVPRLAVERFLLSCVLDEVSP
jgi:DNA polymerase-3 subunit delta'